MRWTARVSRLAGHAPAAPSLSDLNLTSTPSSECTSSSDVRFRLFRYMSSLSAASTDIGAEDWKEAQIDFAAILKNE